MHRKSNFFNMNKINKKVNFSDYQGKFDEKLKIQLRENPESIDTETMRAFLYGYTFTDDYAQMKDLEELSMDYWKERAEEAFWENIENEDYDIDTEFEKLETLSISDVKDMYLVDSIQERLLLKTIDSTGDGKSPETALCVISVDQEYEYLERVVPYCNLKLACQSVCDGIDCLEFEPNIFNIDRIYFDISRRFEVGYN